MPVDDVGQAEVQEDARRTYVSASIVMASQVMEAREIMLEEEAEKVEPEQEDKARSALEAGAAAASATAIAAAGVKSGMKFPPEPPFPPGASQTANPTSAGDSQHQQMAIEFDDSNVEFRTILGEKLFNVL